MAKGRGRGHLGKPSIRQIDLSEESERVSTIMDRIRSTPTPSTADPETASYTFPLVRRLGALSLEQQKRLDELYTIFGQIGARTASQGPLCAIILPSFRIPEGLSETPEDIHEIVWHKLPSSKNEARTARVIAVHESAGTGLEARLTYEGLRSEVIAGRSAAGNIRLNLGERQPTRTAPMRIVQEYPESIEPAIWDDVVRCTKLVFRQDNGQLPLGPLKPLRNS